MPLRYEKQIDHFRPQNGFEGFTNEWTNLLLACPSCNQEKGDDFPLDADDDPLLIDPSDPSDVDPQDHITFTVSTELRARLLVGAASELGGSARGKATIKTVGLDSADHRRSRFLLHVRLLELHYQLLRARDEGDDEEIGEAIRRLEKLMSSESAYASFARSFAREADLIALGVSIP